MYEYCFISLFNCYLRLGVFKFAGNEIETFEYQQLYNKPDLSRVEIGYGNSMSHIDGAELRKINSWTSDLEMNLRKLKTIQCDQKLCWLKTDERICKCHTRTQTHLATHTYTHSHKHTHTHTHTHILNKFK